MRKIDSSKSINVAGVVLKLVDSVKIVGVVVDSQLSFDKHVTDICSSANYHIHALCHIRPFLTQDMTATLACSIVASRIDYCNAVLNGVATCHIERFQ